MIYLDNAATTRRKPPEVISAVSEAMQSLGNAGRGVHSSSLKAATTVMDTRRLLADFFNAEDFRRMVFTNNSTEALNISIQGLINPGDHVITTVLEHNSVLRPLYLMETAGAELSFVHADEYGRPLYDEFESLIRDNTRAIVCTHGSNLTGNLVDIARVGKIAHDHGLLFIVDASQTAGVFPIDVQEMNIDCLCFTGHKSMLGPQGTGGLYVKTGVDIRPFKVGGTGVQSYSKTQPDQMPTLLEAGTLNGHGIAGLHAAAEYIKNEGIDNIRRREQDLMWRFYDGVKDIPGIKIYGDFGEDTGMRPDRCPIVSLNIGDYDSGEVSDVLFTDWEICTRPGAHCAPLMHKSLGTDVQGAVRFSFSHYNTEEEIDTAISAVKELAGDADESVR